MMTNPFSATGFDLLTGTAAINRIPNAERYIGMTEQYISFTPKPVTTTTISVEEQNGVLNLLVSQPRGGPALKNVGGKRKLRSFTVPHYPLEDVVKAEEYQNVRAFGSDNQLETEAGVFARKLADMRRKHDLTREWLRMMAIKGILVDGDNSTLYNYFTEFGITQEVQDFDLDDSATEVNEECRGVIQHIEDNLKGDTMSGVVAFCSRSFYNAFIKHASVKEAFKYYSTTQQLSGNFSKRFEFAGITWVPVGASTTDPDGNVRKFIEDDYAYAVPVGTSETFMEVIAPADFNETANTLGVPYYAKAEPRRFNRGLDVHTQMNVLPVCTRPDVIVKIGRNID